MDEILKRRRQIKALKDQLDDMNADGVVDLNEDTTVEMNAVMDQMEELREEIRVLERRGELYEDLNAPADDSRNDGTRQKITFPGHGLRLGEVFQGLARGIRQNREPDKIREYRMGVERAITGQGESIPADGGFLLEKEHQASILQRVYGQSSLITRAQRFPIGANKNGIKIPRVDETSRADGSRWGGVRGYWTDEGAALTASQSKFGQVSMDLEKLTCLIYATSELVDDSVALERYINTVAPQELAFKVDEAIVNGDGSGKPAGIIPANCTVSVTKETSQVANTIVTENVIKAYARSFPDGRRKSVWIANSDCLPQLMTMSLAVGTGGSPVWLPTNSMAGRPFDTLMGLPIIYSEQAPTVGDKGDLILADMNQYLFIEKDSGIQTAMSIHVRFVNDEAVFRFVWRVNGQPWWSSALTPFKGADSTSPFVVIAARD